MTRATALLRAAIVLTVLVAILAQPSAVTAQTGPGTEGSAPAGAVDGEPATAPASADDAPTSSAQPSAAPASSGPSLLDLLKPIVDHIADFLLNHVLVGLLQGIATALHKVVDAILGSAFNFVARTPPGASYDSPTVQSLSGAVRGIANAALALVALWGGLNLIVRPHIGAPYHDLMETLPRLVLGALLVNTSGWWTRLAIDANNALCDAVGQTSLPAWDRADVSSQLIVDLISVLVYLVTGLLLVLQQLMRLALVDVLLVVAPLGMLCWVLPQTQGYARLWSSTFAGTVFTQFVQVVALKVGGSLMTDLQPMSADAAIVSLFLGVAVMLLTLKIPDLMRGQLGDGLGFARFYAYRGAARGLEGAVSQAGRAARGGA